MPTISTFAQAITKLTCAGLIAFSMPSWAQVARDASTGTVRSAASSHGREQMGQRMVERRTSHLLDAIEATPEQRSKIMAIAKAAHKDIAPLREQQREDRKRARELMLAPTIDATAIEKIRQDQSKRQDQMSLRRTSAMLESMQLLNPAQRTQLAERMQRRPGGAHDRMNHHRMKGRTHGMRHEGSQGAKSSPQPTR